MLYEMHMTECLLISDTSIARAVDILRDKRLVAFQPRLYMDLVAMPVTTMLLPVFLQQRDGRPLTRLSVMSRLLKRLLYWAEKLPVLRFWHQLSGPVP